MGDDHLNTLSKAIGDIAEQVKRQGDQLEKRFTEQDIKVSRATAGAAHSQLGRIATRQSLGSA